MRNYDHKKIESKIQREWEKKKLYKVVDNRGKKFYPLVEFPYPSGAGMHVGHIRSYTAMDIVARKRRMEGYNVLYPIGWDAFGLPTENYAIKTGQKPAVVTKKNTDTFRKQLKSLGFSFDWSREINTTDPKYYKWTQWIFLQLFKKGLAYKAKSYINWCLSCKIGLANEEVVDGKCERCGGNTEKREKEQWMLAITKYADRLHQDLDLVDYPERVKIQQRNWIGKSEGAEIEFKINLPPDPLPKEGGKTVLGTFPLGRLGGVKGVFGYHTTDPKAWRALQDRVLEMRKNPTEAEEKLWQLLRKNLTGYHFRRQHIVGRFVVDFVCLEKSLIVEVDGDIHDCQVSEDQERTEFLSENGFRVIRFRNEEITGNLEKVREKIKEELEALPFGEGWSGIDSVKVFTTRADTLFGATYLVLAPEHPLVRELGDGIENLGEVLKYVSSARRKSEVERTNEEKEKTGIELKGIKVVNPANSEEIPVWTADYVLPDYGTGAIMAVPAHDERDFTFAKKYNLPVTQVIAEETGQKREKETFKDGGAGVVFDPKTQLYAVERWRDDGRLGFFAGGKEERETAYEAVIREVKEESGFYDFRYVERVKVCYAHYYNKAKKENRNVRAECVLFILNSSKQNTPQLEKHENFEVVWLPAEKILEAFQQRNADNSYDHYIVFLKAGVSRAIELGFDRKSDPKVFYTQPFVGEGILENSGNFTGLKSKDAWPKIVKKVGGKIVTKFKLRDWVFSRQRYWGEPIPLVFCPACAKKCGSLASAGLRKQGFRNFREENAGWIPVPEKDLPVKLPEVKSYKPTDTGESPLVSISKWVNTKCPKCKGPAKRETDTMPNWAGSSWYYLRYTDPKNDKEFASKKNLKYWMAPLPDPPQRGGRESKVLPFGEDIGGVDWYNGGMEHTTLHLLYSRFWHKFLYDLKLVPTVEPYRKRTSHGMILGEGGVKMSKSLGNVVNPDDVVKIYGADTLRVYEMFIGPFEDAVAWSTESIIGSRRFIEKVWRIGQKVCQRDSLTISLSKSLFDMRNHLRKLLHKTIKKVSEDIESMRFNTAISSMMILATEMESAFAQGYGVTREDFKKFLQILAPFASYVTEELYNQLRIANYQLETEGKKYNSIHASQWPKWDANLIKDDEIKIAVQVNGKVRAEILIETNDSEESVKRKALMDPGVSKYIIDGDVKKVIYVKSRLINIVT